MSFRRSARYPFAPVSTVSDRAPSRRGEPIATTCLALAPANAYAWHYLGKAAEQQGDLAAAIEHLGRAAALNPRFAPTHNDLGALLQQMGERDAALGIVCSRAAR